MTNLMNSGKQKHWQKLPDYTPGPWDAYLEADGSFGVYQNLGNHNGDHIMAVEGSQETAANLRLIGAAPMLFEALSATIQALEDGKEFQGEVLEVIAQGREAILKVLRG